MNTQVYYRLIALWVLSEAMLGGIIHGLNIPVSGLLVGGCAVACISLIAWYQPVRGAILKATIIVAVFKMMLSPQAPPPAYIAVFFQGVMGELLFRKDRKFFRVTCILFAVVSLLESGLQRILVLTILYGNDLWVVINNFIKNITHSKVAANYSLFIGIGYVLLHILTGLFAGTLIAGLPSRIAQWSADRGNVLVIDLQENSAFPLETQKRKRRRVGLLLVWLVLVVLYIQSYYRIGTPLLPAHISLKILLRSLIIVLTWVFIVTPLLKMVLHKWLQRKQSQSGQEVQQVLELLPLTKQLLIKSWKQSAGSSGLKKITRWLKYVLVNILSPQIAGPDNKVVMLVAPVQTGKTTSLIGWSAERNDVFGILTPVVNGRRMFMDASSRQLFLMEAKEEEGDTLAVGKYRFSRQNFDKASQVIRKAIDKKGWLIIDEIGPLELKGEGFSEVLKEVLDKRKNKMILVVRDKDEVAEKVKNSFGLQDAIMISHTGAL